MGQLLALAVEVERVISMGALLRVLGLVLHEAIGCPVFLQWNGEGADLFSP